MNGQRLNVHKNKNYTVMSNYHLRETEMTLKAKGLLSVILSLPPEWDYSIAGLVAISKENETAIKSALRELKQFGYLKVTKLMPSETESGRIEYSYDIYEEPSEDLIKEFQSLEKQEAENQPLENPGQLSINNQLTENKIIKNKNNDQPAKPADSALVSEFEELWKDYPRKQGKNNALKAYVKARKSGIDKVTIQNGIERYNAQITANKTNMKYVKQGSTWFGQHCWDDVYDINVTKTTTTPKTKQDHIDDEWLNSLE